MVGYLDWIWLDLVTLVVGPWSMVMVSWTYGLISHGLDGLMDICANIMLCLVGSLGCYLLTCYIIL